MRFTCEPSSDEEKTLRYLIDSMNKGMDVYEIVSAWYTAAPADDESSRRFADCKGLAEVGFLNMTIDESGNLEVGDITSLGRCYFHDKAEREAAQSAKLQSERSHNYRVAIVGGIFGLFSGMLGSVIVNVITSWLPRAAEIGMCIAILLWHCAEGFFGFVVP